MTFAEQLQTGKQFNFTSTITRTELKKYLHCHLNGHGKVVKFSTFQSNIAIFDVQAVKGNSFNLSSCKFLCANVNKKGKLITTYTMDLDGLSSVLREILFFARFPKSKEKMSFPFINLKHLKHN